MPKSVFQACRRILLPVVFAVTPALLASGQQTAPANPCPAQPCWQIPAVKQTIVVTGTFAPVPLNDIERSVSALPVRETAAVYGNLMDYLEDDPSLDLQQRAPNGVQQDLGIRGSAFGQTLVLINGLRVDDAQSGHHNLDLPLPLASVDRIEVLRGAGSTFYGSDAVGGAVNFITQPPPATEFRMGASFGNFDTNEQSASAGYVRGRVAEQLSFARDFSTGFAPDRDYRSLALASDGHLKTGLGNTDLLLAYSDRPFGADQFYGNFDSWERTKAWFAGLHQELGENTEFDFGYRRHTDWFVLLRDQPNVYQNNHITDSWQTALRRHDQVSQNGTISYGGELYRDSIDSNNLGIHARNRGAVYTSYDLRALRRFSFSAGAREEFYNSTRTQFSPTAALGFWIARGFKLHASASRAFRLPTYTDLYYHDPANVGSPDLRPESAWSYEGGLGWDNGGLVRAGVTVFQRREHDGIDYVKRSPDDVWRATNIDNLRFTGVEVFTTLRMPHGNRINFDYTGLHGAQTALNGMMSRYVFNYPIHNGIVGWYGQLPGKLLTRTRVGVTERYGRDPYAVWDAAVSRQFGYVIARAAFSNLTGTRYEEVEGVAMPGRSFLVGLELVLPRR